MFWKKKKAEDEFGGKKLFKMPTETRGAFRVYPSKGNPIILKFDGKTVSAVDISSGGISFDNKGFQKGTSYTVEMTLPKDPEPITAKMVIIKIDEKEVCRCSISELSPEQEDQIHSYVLRRQKEELAEKKHRPE